MKPKSPGRYSRRQPRQKRTSWIFPSILNEALKELVLTDRFLDQLGPALASQKSIFLYGPTGNGKTSVMSRLSSIYRDAIVIPHAVEVDGQIIVLYDPAVHEKIELDTDGLDQRWVICRRPCIIVSPVSLLNRWIVPLDRRVDYLTLRYGLKFEIPFEMTVVFSNNLDPNDLADEAFLRRIHNKIYVEAMNEKVFDGIFQREVEKRKLPYDPNSSAILRKLCLHLGPNELRACYPADVLDIITAASAYQGQPPEVTPESLKQAVMLYFTKPKPPPAEKR